MATTPFAPVMPMGPFQLNPQPKSKADNYWNAVHQEANRLYVERHGAMLIWITSIEDRMNQVTGGRVCETDVRSAAMRLIGRTHRVATPEEIEGEHKRIAKNEAAYAIQEEKTKNQTISKPSPEQMQTQADLIGAVVQAVLERVTAPQPQIAEVNGIDGKSAVESQGAIANAMRRATHQHGKEEKESQ